MEILETILPVNDINIPDRKILAELKHKIDQKTKPLGSLGRLEDLALQIGLVQQSTKPSLKNPVWIVAAADHGIAATGVSPYPQEVTYQMVYNFINQGAAINVFCRQHQIEVKIVDAGVNHDFPFTLPLEHHKIAYGTRNMLHEPAMKPAECKRMLDKGAQLVQKQAASGSNVIGFGEMGIGNTSAAALNMHKVCNLPLELCVGAGTGHDSAGVSRKLEILRQVSRKYQLLSPSPLEILQTFGGFEIAFICGGILAAAENRMLILVDGFIVTAALLIAAELHPEVLSYCIFSHCSGENGHRRMLEYLNVHPLLDLGMRLGEGTGAALAYPLVESAVRFLNEMASFDDAKVSKSV